MSQHRRTYILSMLSVLLIFSIVLLLFSSVRALIGFPPPQEKPVEVEVAEQPPAEVEQVIPPVEVSSPIEIEQPQVIEVASPVEVEVAEQVISEEIEIEREVIEDVPEIIEIVAVDTSEPIVGEQAFVEDWWEDFSEEDPWADFVFEEEDEYDPWADFYVAGEEDYSIFSDGSYLVPLFVNGDYLDDLDILFSDSSILIEVEQLNRSVGPLLTEEFRNILFDTDNEYLSLEELQELDIEAWYDYMSFELHLEFTTWMMPVRILSINRANIARYSSYEMSGSESLKPALFSWYNNISVFSLIDINEANDWKIKPLSLLTLQSRNSIAIGPVGFDFSYTFHPGRAYNETREVQWSDDWEDYITFQGIQGFFDIKSKSLRVLFGNVTDYLGYSKDSVGIGLEKRYNYGDVKPKNHQFEYKIEVDEPSLVEIFINGKSVYRRELQAGIYKLRDFIFAQGANKAIIEITPLYDESLKKEIYFNLAYDSRLLAKGDTLYSMGLSFPNFDFENPNFRINQQIGVIDSMSLSYTLGASLNAINASLQTTVATNIGPIDLYVAGSYSEPLKFGHAERVSYRLSSKKENTIFGGFDISVGYQSGSYNTSLNVMGLNPSTLSDMIDLSASTSGNFGPKIRYYLSGNLNWDLAFENPNWRASATLGTSIIPKVSLNGSLNLFNSPLTNKVELKGQISGSVAITTALNVSVYSDVETSVTGSLNWRVFKTKNNSMQFNLSGIDFTDPLNSFSGNATFNHSSKAFGLSLRQQFSENFKKFTTSVSFNTAIAYAGGLIGITRSIGDNFLLVRPKGALKGADIAVTRTMTSEPASLPSLFGTSTYSTINTHQKNNIVIYGVGDSIVSSGGSYIYDFTPRPRQGYAVKLFADKSYSVVGTLLRKEDASYSRYTTDLWRVELNENGNEELVYDESLYLFTDETGFFFINGVSSGTYQFSLYLPGSDEDDLPIDIRFTIVGDPKSTVPQVYILENFVATTISDAFEQLYFDQIMGIDSELTIFDENGYFWLNIEMLLEEDDFWNDYFPNRSLVQSTFDDEMDFFSDEPRRAKKESALTLMSEQQRGFILNLSRLNFMVKPYLDLILPKL